MTEGVPAAVFAVNFRSLTIRNSPALESAKKKLYQIPIRTKEITQNQLHNKKP